MKKAGFLFNDKDKENLAIVEKLVEERFSLDQSSLDYFKEQIQDPDLSDVFFEAFKKAGSSRIVIDVPEEVESKMDYGWSKIFKTKFWYFIEKTGLTFNDYKQNKIEINKNTFKIKKALTNFYTQELLTFAEETAEEAKDTIDPPGYIRREMEKLVQDCSGKYSFLRNGYNRTLNRLKLHIKGIHLLNSMKEDESLTDGEKAATAISCDENKRDLIENIENAFETEWIICAENKLSKDKLQLVISFNYADMFLCSTGESWTSCLNLNGSSANYWYGLPGLMGDKNRVMIYLTRGERKASYGIETDKFLFRTWALLNEDNELNIVRWFPKEDIGNYSLYRLIEEKTGITVNKNYLTLSKNNDFHSKHEVELIYTTDGWSLFPYLDYADFTSGDETYIISGDSGMLHKKRGGGYVYSDEMCSYDDFCSLTDLIDNNTDIISASEINKKYCEHCNSDLYEDEEYFTPDGSIVCERCFNENYFVCNHCGETHSNDDGIYVDGDGYYCNECFHEHFFHCEITDEVYSLDDAVTVTDDRKGRNTFLASYQAAESNGYIINETDNTFYKSEFMICDKHGDYIHIDEYEKQLELDLEVAV